MRSVSLIANKTFRLLFLLILAINTQVVSAQDNSPYSRYGLGDLVPAGNMANRSMGGISAAYTDFQTINFLNPAGYGSLTNTVFDVAGELLSRTIKSNLAPSDYKTNNLLVSYLQFGVPIATKSMQKKGLSWGFGFGLQPVTRIAYKLREDYRISNVDSASSLFEGFGGLNRFSIGTGIKYKNFRVGFSAGANFGSRETTSRQTLINDSVVYYRSLREVKTNLSGVSLSGGLIYDIPVRKNILRFGAYANYFKRLKTETTQLDATFLFDPSGESIPVDTISFKQDIKGEISMPLQLTGGISWNSTHWLFGADYEFWGWSDYRENGKAESVRNTWKIRTGAQYYPASENTDAKKYFQFVKYRLGFYYGPDYINLNGERNDFALTLGAGFPLTSFQLLRRGEYVLFNTGMELGSRGSKDLGSIRENTLRFNFGISMDARWFQKSKYD